MTHMPRWFALLPLPAILLGAFVAWRSGVPATAFAVNVLAAALGVGTAALVGRLSSTALPQASVPIAFVAVLLTASTLLFPGLDGVHRWLVLGSVRLHASTLAVPWVLLGMSAALHQRFAVSAGLALGMSAVHALQPDAGQGTAFALAASALLACAPSTPWLLRAASCSGTLVLGFAAWLRPDPLAAVPHVERIVHLAASVAPALGVAAVLALALLLLPAALVTERARASGGQEWALPASLVVYIAATLGVTTLGNFPVPVMGAGAGPILGWYAATGILAAAWATARVSSAAS
ncbi:hypothetical protein COCOR_01827 [Corallococcus coralloides DSM 2259]|uniref:Uncharacterized protein n=1 Tax=Corallococcus coralloides (strain ATCC 25202 / DSM 2259 / NBRC 100086 / M2) TaxID=1144275 RepID=H8MET8_CORCM|nr:hypothetical protein [Corallococcus coralloides]AFE04317.1 hypothetical protein COCOR_01827 [Corallococcus coralloides DSM 2259]